MSDEIERPSNPPAGASKKELQEFSKKWNKYLKNNMVKTKKELVQVVHTDPDL